MTVIDERYYDGFYGDDEIFFILKDNGIVQKGIGIWNGYLYDIMYDNIKPAPEGWQGITYHYHVEGLEKYTDEDPLKIDDLSLIYEQFASVTNDMLRYKESADVLNLIIDMIKEAIYKKKELYLYVE